VGDKDVVPSGLAANILRTTCHERTVRIGFLKGTFLYFVLREAHSAQTHERIGILDTLEEQVSPSGSKMFKDNRFSESSER
jgi:hypothetical protein